MTSPATHRHLPVLAWIAFLLLCHHELLAPSSLVHRERPGRESLPGTRIGNNA